MKKSPSYILGGIWVGGVSGFIMYFLEGYVIIISVTVGGLANVPEEFKSAIIWKSLLFGVLPGIIAGIYVAKTWIDEKMQALMIVSAFASTIVLLSCYLTLFHYPNSELTRKMVFSVLFSGFLLIFFNAFIFVVVEEVRSWFGEKKPEYWWIKKRKN